MGFSQFSIAIYWLELSQVFSDWVNWKAKIYNRWKWLKSKPPEIFLCCEQKCYKTAESNHSQIPLKTTEHFSHKNTTKQKSSTLVFSGGVHSLYEILSKYEVLKSQTGWRSCSCQTLFTQSLEDKVNRGWRRSAGKDRVIGHFFSDQDEYQPLAFGLAGTLMLAIN